MFKTFIIIKREYLTRVRKKSFIITTLLFPLLYFALIGGTTFLAKESKEVLNIAIVDSSGYFTKDAIALQNKMDNSSVLTLVPSAPTAELKADSSVYDGYIVIPALDWKKGNSELKLMAAKSYGSATTNVIESKLNRIWSTILNDSLQIDVAKQAILQQSQLQVSALNIIDKTANTGMAEGIGYVSGILMYMILLIYGSQVMMGVMEEKTNRIAEVIVSSVKPFQMMLGKIIGIGMVALTQFFLWVAFVFALYNIGKESGHQINGAEAVVANIQQLFTSVNVPLIIFCFAFYFLAGFFFYASLYGAIGSSVNEDMREAQSLSFPITMLVIISISLMTTAIANPSGNIAFWGSMIPFSSPIVMMARIPYGVPGTVPYWQLGLSMGILVVSFIFTVWFAGKIYRTGILMYGKKPSWKELIKWALKEN